MVDNMCTIGGPQTREEAGWVGQFRFDIEKNLEVGKVPWTWSRHRDSDGPRRIDRPDLVAIWFRELKSCLMSIIETDWSNQSSYDIVANIKALKSEPVLKGIVSLKKKHNFAKAKIWVQFPDEVFFTRFSMVTDFSFNSKNCISIPNLYLKSREFQCPIFIVGFQFPIFRFEM
jgi:hypothetical protein